MKTASALYKMVRALNNSWYEWRVTQGNNTYGMDKLKSISVSASLASESGIDIGNANSTKCEMTLMEQSSNWARMAKFTIDFRICLGNSGTKSEWITFGAYYTDQRSEDKQGNLTIIGYDAMLKMEQSWTDRIPSNLLPASYPITAKAWATMIQSAGLATFEDLTQLDDTVAFVGLDTTSSIRDVLKSIAAVHGGNWTALANDKLTLLPYQIRTGKNLLDNSSYSSGKSSGNEITFTKNSDGSWSTSGTNTSSSVRTYCIGTFNIESGETYTLSGCPSGGGASNYRLDVRPTSSSVYSNWIDTGGGYADATKTASENKTLYVYIRIASGCNASGLTFKPMVRKSTEPAGYEPYYSGTPYVTLGTALEDIEDSPALSAVSGVHLETEGGVIAEAGDDTGYRISAMCDFSTTTGVAALCLSKITGFVYKPFVARGAYLDPITEIGDTVSIDSKLYQVMEIEWDFTKLPIATLAAPYDEEIDHEYMIVSEDAKNYRKTMASVDAKVGEYSTAIEQNAHEISLIAEHTIVIDEQIAVIQNQIDGNIQSWSGNYVPTLNNAPASNWTTTTDKAEHVGDLYFVNSDAGIPEAGTYYRFEENNGVYSWQILTDSALTEALNKAAAALAAAEDAQDTADASMTEAQLKGRIFVNTPTPPYDVGDLWFHSTQSVIKVCMNAKAAGASFADSDWVKRDMYTDDSGLSNFINNTYNVTIPAIQTQLDKKAETYYQSSNPAMEWGVHPVGVAVAGVDVVGTPSSIGNNHEGDLWYNTTNNTTWYWTGTAWEQQDIPTEVFDMIDGKAQIFVNQPTSADAYDVGDLWVKATYSDSNVNYSNDILKCKTRKVANAQFDIAHWELASKYTDDSALTSFVNTVYDPAIAAIQENLDGKIDTYFYAYAPTLSNAPASSWDTTAKKDAHVDDLFYNTATGYTYRFTKSGSTYSWARVKDQDITAAMSTASTAQDTADGKRRVFVAQPTNAQAYDIGDLWVNATYGSTYSNDLLKCKTAKAAGATFSIAHWEKASKYTDDTAANAVAQSLTTFQSTFSVQPSQISAEIEKRVIKDQSTTKSTFGWKLTDSSHIWYSNNSEVMKIQQSGLTVTGNINAVGGSIAIGTNNQSQTVFSVTNQGVLTARSGYIGNGSSGFTISATAIYNGMTALGDTSHNGIYLGTDGIALGKGNFKVTSGGQLTAKNGYIGNGSSGFTIGSTSISNGMTSFSDTQHNGVYVGTDGIALGGGAIKLYADGTLEATDGFFLGLVQASSIVSKVDDPSFGTFSGQGLTEYSVYGGSGGQIGYTGNGGIIGANMEYSTISDAYTDSGINTNLLYASRSNDIFRGITTADYLRARYVSASDQLIVGGYDVVWQYSSTLGGYVLMRSTA